jgi:hypothetical protein
MKNTYIPVIALIFCHGQLASAQSFQVTNVFMNPQNEFTVKFPSDASFYFVLNRLFQQLGENISQMFFNPFPPILLKKDRA